jgi:hypothetical protein
MRPDPGGVPGVPSVATTRQLFLEDSQCRTDELKIGSEAQPGRGGLMVRNNPSHEQILEAPGHRRPSRWPP